MLRSGSVRVWLSDESIGVEAEESEDFIVEVTDLLYGPFGLRPGTV